MFASLHSISEVEKAGVDYIRQIGHQKPKDVYFLFQSFIRQAKTFYDSANTLHYRASTLNYYYAFLNLAKAFICLKLPDAVSGRVTHGLSLPRNFSSGSFSKQFINIENNGVFNYLYKSITGKVIKPKIKLNISRILSYCSDIEYEYQSAGYGKSRLVPTTVRVMSDMQQKISWPMIAAVNFDLLQPYKGSLSKFHKYFDEVDADKNLAFQAFGIRGETLPTLTFFESNKTYNWLEGDKTNIREIMADLFNALDGISEANPYNEDFDIFLVAPLMKSNQVLLNQTLATYVTMFYLSSLVRYQPAYLETLLNSKDAWIIERFAYSAPSTFLRSIGNLILQKDYVYIAR